MKKKIALLLCAVMFVLSLFSLVACTNDNDGGNNTGSGENPPITDPVPNRQASQARSSSAAARH